MDYKEDLRSLITEEYGKVLYSYTCHWEEITILSKLDKKIKICEILFTAVCTTGLIGFLISNIWWATLVSTICSALSLCILLYAKDCNLDERIIRHQNIADELWMIKEQYLTLLTDLPKLNEDMVCERRDYLLEKSSEIYKFSISTSSKAYNMAQMQLKENGYQFFTQEELNKILPKHLRKYFIQVVN